MDNNEREQLQDQFLEAQKMEAVGRLAGGLAHDFSNMLGIIILHLAIMMKEMSPDDKFHPHVKGIKEAAEQAVFLTRQLLTLSHRQRTQPREVDLNSIVIEIDKMLHRLIGEDIELVLNLGPDAIIVTIDPGQLEQVLMNLAVNARNAMPQGGRLSIETANVSLNKSYLSRHLDVSSGAYAMLIVSDTGRGMDKKARAHIFEPFFSTEETGKGPGIGLSATHEIVKQNGGFIEVYSEPGQGTTFKIFFPTVKTRAKKACRSLQIAESDQLRGSETVLVVEDEDKLRELISDALVEYGYTVLSARCGEEALRICKQHQGLIHLMLTDVVMPQMGGGHLAECLLPLNPQMEVIYMSGHMEDIVVHHLALDKTAAFIQKPFSLITLVVKIREVLDSVQIDNVNNVTKLNYAEHAHSFPGNEIPE